MGMYPWYESMDESWMNMDDMGEWMDDWMMYDDDDSDSSSSPSPSKKLSQIQLRFRFAKRNKIAQIQLHLRVAKLHFRV